jgi:hypothetical protein
LPTFGARPAAVAPVDPLRPRPRDAGPVAALPVPAGAEESVGLLRAMPPG